MNSLKDTLPMTFGSDEVMVMVSDGGDGDGDGAMDGNVLPVAMFVKHTLYGSGENWSLDRKKPRKQLRNSH